MTTKNLLLFLVLSASTIACFKAAKLPNKEIQTDVKDSVVTTATNGNGVTPDMWPSISGGAGLDPAIEARIDGLIAKMTLREMVGQTIQADINSIKPQDLLEYPLGSVLNGGNSAPGADVRAPAPEWLALADEFYHASKDKTGGKIGIPILWGTDSVHGHNNVVGATVFPHNIGLGAARNAPLMRQIGAITALETRVTGQDWTFAPTVAVVRNDRWGRTYESYSEDPEIVAEYARQMVEGVQGGLGEDDWIVGSKVISTTKHFLGDGGTVGGKDQGDNIDSEQDLRDIHAAGYIPALDAGVQSVMASFSSWNGVRMHGHKGLLQDILKDKMGFDGFVVGDWNGHGQVAGCDPTDCPASLMAGLDMYMAPDTWKPLFANTLKQAESGIITRDRLEDAVRRILRVKLRAGLFEAPAPSERPYAGQYELLGNTDHMDIARQAVRESLVLLKNNGVLPIESTANVLVTGDGANDIGKQAGGWTLSWQGTGNSHEDFPTGRSIWGGIHAAVTAGGGTAVLSEDGLYSKTPDVAIIVFGEDPYAEFMGDIATLDYQANEPSDLTLLRTFKDRGIPVVSIFLSGRPLWVNPEINASDAFVAAWLPGSAGEGIADVLISNFDGSINHDFKGKLSFSWPKKATQTVLNVGDKNYDPLFPYGYGLTYSSSKDFDRLSEDSGIKEEVKEIGVFFNNGSAPDPWSIKSEGDVAFRNVDRVAQEDAISTSWTGDGALSITGDAVSFVREMNGDVAISIQYRVDSRTEGEVFLGLGETSIDISKELAKSTMGEWSSLDITLSCFANKGADLSKLDKPFSLSSGAGLNLSISYIGLNSNEGQAICLD